MKTTRRLTSTSVRHHGRGSNDTERTISATATIPAVMDLTFSESETAFRAECRAWLEGNVPHPALPSGDTAEGFALHREWERKLFDARWAVVSWPREYGGRDASLWEWLI